MLNNQNKHQLDNSCSNYFENVLELRLEINWKLTKILALAPKNCDFVSDIFMQNLISFEKYSQVLKKVNELYSRIETKKIFKPAMKNQINFDLIKKYKVLNRLNHLNQKAKIIELQEMKLIKMVQLLIKKSFSLSQFENANKEKIENIINELSDILKDFQYDIQTINKVINLKQEIENLEKLNEESDIFEKNCYIYKNSSWEEILVTINWENEISQCAFIVKKWQIVSNIQRNIIKNYWKNNKNKFVKIIKTPKSKKYLLEIITRNFYLERKLKNDKKSKKSINQNINSNLNFSWEYTNSKWKIINFKVENWIVQYWYFQNWESINIQQKSAIQRFINQNNFKKFINIISKWKVENIKKDTTSNVENIINNNLENLAWDCELFEWWYKQSLNNSEVIKELANEFVLNLKKYFEFTKLKQVLHKIHPDKARNEIERELFTRISRIVIEIMNYQKKYN